MTNFKTIERFINDIKQAAILSAVITFLFILIEVPIVIFYILTKWIVTFMFTLLGMALYHLVLMLWAQLTSSSSKESEA